MDIAGVVSLVVGLAVLCALSLLLSLRRRVDKLSHTPDSEQRAALLKISGDVDRGKAASQGWLF